MSKIRTPSDARDRIVQTAERLFYAHGVRAVGIDRIIAEAEVAKMTLYNHFSSKDDLILAVLEYREGQVDEFFRSSVERFVEEGMDRMEAFFATLKAWFDSSGFRGCSFINASVELADPSHPASQFVRQHKCSFREMLTEIITEVAGKKAALAAPAVSVLVEGAIVTAVIEGSSDSADIAKDAALTLISKAKRARGK